MRTIDTVRTGQNATAADCGRLWQTLTTEYIRDLKINLVPLPDPDNLTGVKIEIISDGIDSLDGEVIDDVWASATFFNQLHLISAGSLFDLLITAYRRIDDYFTHGERFAPARRKR
jgi:hypothetical protein